MTNLNRPTALIIGAIALIISAISPWITVFGFISAGPTNFTEVALVVFIGIFVTIVSAFTRRGMRIVSICVGLAVLVEVGHVWFVLSEQSTNALVTPGWGLYFTTAACLYLLASTWIARKQTPMDKYHIRSVTVADSPDRDEV